MCVLRALPAFAVALERRQRGLLVRGATARTNCRSSKRRTQRDELARGRARAPPASELVEREADPLAALRVDEHGVSGVVEALGLRLRSRTPSTPARAARACRAGSRIRPVIACLSRNDLRELGRVVGRVDRDAEHRHVVPEVVERAADRLHLRRAGVLAGRVDERHDDRPPAERRQR